MRFSYYVTCCLTLVACGGGSEGVPDTSPPDDGAVEQLQFPDGGAPREGGGADAVDPNDWDGDGLTNDEEEQLGTNPRSKDTDNDGVEDSEEVGDIGKPSDQDNDGKIDALEPSNFDSDLDGTQDDLDQDDTDGKCGQIKRLFDRIDQSQDLTLAKDCSPYKVLGYLRVKDGATLTVMGDVTVTFGPDAMLEIVDSTSKAGLNLAGTKNATTQVVHPVFLSADASTPSKGYWRGVVVRNGASIELNHTTVEHAGGPTNSADPQALVWVKLADSIKVKSSTLREGKGYGLHAGFKAVAPATKLFSGFADSTFKGLDHSAALHIFHLGEIGSGNTFEGDLRVKGGDVDKPATWKALGAPYVFEENALRINADLQIQEAVKLVLAANTAIRVGYNTMGTGRVVAQGTSGQPVIFTTASGALGSWQGLILDYGKNVLEHVQVIGAGYPSSVPASTALYRAQTAELTAKEVTIQDSSGKGVYYYLAGSGCTTQETKDFIFGGTITECKFWCADDANTGTCLVQ